MISFMNIVNENDVCELLQNALEAGLDKTELYDVDMFIYDVIHGYDWSGYTNPDSPINFITGVMKWCRTNTAGKYFSDAGLVIIFCELQDWAYKFWEVTND